MSQPLYQLQSLLLDLLSSCRSVDTREVAELDEEDWNAIRIMMNQHRLAPLLHWRLTRERIGLPIPKTITDELASSFRAHTLRSLTLQRELLNIHDLLTKAGIPFIALKGAYLAFYVYPHPALRPLRDLDILVPEKWVLSTFRTLLDNGYRRLHDNSEQGHDRPDPTMTYLDRSKHLPPLICDLNRIIIELHASFMSPEDLADTATDIADDPGIWQRLIQSSLAGANLSYLAPTDLLLHLIVHAVYDHRFNNGPLIFSDIAFLLASHTIDWPQFWSIAHSNSQTRGCLLILTLVERYYGKQPIEWPNLPIQATVPEHVISAAALLSLGDFETSHGAKLMALALGHKHSRNKLNLIFKKCFPSREYISQTYSVPVDSPKIYYFYGHRLFNRARRYASTFFIRRTSVEARTIIELEQWLAAPQ